MPKPKPRLYVKIGDLDDEPPDLYCGGPDIDKAMAGLMKALRPAVAKLMTAKITSINGHEFYDDLTVYLIVGNWTDAETAEYKRRMKELAK